MEELNERLKDDKAALEERLVMLENKQDLDGASFQELIEQKSKIEKSLKELKNGKNSGSGSGTSPTIKEN